jgi:hypothetical protein
LLASRDNGRVDPLCIDELGCELQQSLANVRAMVEP